MKAKIVLEQASANREKWLDLKKCTIGSSEITTVCNINPWESRLHLWAVKTGRIEPDKENDAMRYGSFMEPFIGELFARKESKKVIKPDILYAHPEIDWATATPDFFSVPQEVEVISPDDTEIEIVECKTVRPSGRQFWQDGNIPNYAHSQTIWQLGVLGMESAQVAALIGGNTDDFVTVPVTFSKELFDQMLDIAAQFMNMVRSDTPPDANADDIKTLEKLYEIKNEVILLNDETTVKIFEEFKTHNDNRKMYDGLAQSSKKLEDYYRAQLLKAMQGHTSAEVAGYLITNKLVKKKAFEVKASEYFNFKVKKIGEEE